MVPPIVATGSRTTGPPISRSSSAGDIVTSRLALLFSQPRTSVKLSAAGRLSR